MLIEFPKYALFRGDWMYHELIHTYALTLQTVKYRFMVRSHKICFPQYQSTNNNPVYFIYCGQNVKNGPLYAR